MILEPLKKNLKKKGEDLTLETNASNAIEEDKIKALVYSTSIDCDDQSNQSVQASTHENHSSNCVALLQVDKKRFSACTEQEEEGMN